MGITGSLQGRHENLMVGKGGGSWRKERGGAAKRLEEEALEKKKGGKKEEHHSQFLLYWQMPGIYDNRFIVYFLFFKKQWVV